MVACGVCMCGVGECVEGAALWQNSISEEIFTKIWYRSVSNVSFDEIHCAVIT